MAASCAMSEKHRLIVKGPYSRIRHLSYISYCLCIVGVLLLLPSILSFITIIGIPGYYIVALKEEGLLISSFGDEYQLYISRTGRFFPKLNRS